MNDQPYTVRPFSGKKYTHNADRVGPGEPPCAICGKGIKNIDKAHAVCVVDGGASWGDVDSDPYDDGYMGLFFVGPSCHRKHQRR